MVNNENFFLRKSYHHISLIPSSLAGALFYKYFVELGEVGFFEALFVPNECGDPSRGVVFYPLSLIQNQAPVTTKYVFVPGPTWHHGNAENQSQIVFGSWIP